MQKWGWFVAGAIGFALPSTTLHAGPGQGRTDGGRSTAVELSAGGATFLDEAPITHRVFAGSVRTGITPRLDIGPEVVATSGRDGQHQSVTVNLAFDLLPAATVRTGRVTPFLIAGGGLFRSSGRLNGVSFAHLEGAVTGGGGARVWISDHLYVAGELRAGWEPHLRATGTIGVRLR